MKDKVLVTALFFIFASLVTWFLMVKIDFSSQDIGRHLENGKQILNSGLIGNPVLTTNYYSYTYPEFSTFNHHWLSGVLMYLIVSHGSFTLLHICYILSIIISLGIVWYVSISKFGIWPTVLASAALFPLYSYRKEIRPESFSLVIFWLIFLILELVGRFRINKAWLYLIPALMLFWVNLHIYFFLGFGVIAAFIFQNYLLKEKSFTNKEGLFVLLISLIVTLFNPLGIKGLLYPTNIFHEYGYRVLENQTIKFLLDYGLNNPDYYLTAFFLVLVGILLVAGLLLKKIPIAWVILSFGSLFMAYSAVRNISFFAFSATLVLSWGFYLIHRLLKKYFSKIANSIEVVAAGLVLIFITSFYFYSRIDVVSFLAKNASIGASEEDFKSVNFLKTNIKGPIFNNYDVGALLIYTYSSTSSGVFVDNRPESYPVTFFQDVYIPMQENEAVWQKQLNIWRFNSIVFAWRDLTPWGQKFLISRLNDPLWVPVYIDQKVLVLVKDNEKNKDVINQYRLPKEMFIHG